MEKESKNSKDRNTKSITRKRLKTRKENREKRERKNIYILLFSIFSMGVLLIFSAYAWFSTALNVQVRTFNMIVTRNSGLTISLDGIHYDSFVDISKTILIDELKNTYPNNLSQWASNGLVPVSSNGIPNNDTYFFDFYSSSGVTYRNKKREIGYLRTIREKEQFRLSFNRWIAFDVFLKNDTNSPIADNLFIDEGTGIFFDKEDVSEEMQGLLNSARFGFARVGSVPKDTDPTIVQNLQCNGACESFIYEPYSKDHTELSKERAKKYGLHLEDGSYFPTYAYIKQGGPFAMPDTISGAANLNLEYFQLQKTLTDDTLRTPLFEIPDGVTKMRIYVWLEGQDIDSLETNSEGADIEISINFVKDIKGYDSFNPESVNQ